MQIDLLRWDDPKHPVPCSFLRNPQNDVSTFTGDPGDCDLVIGLFRHSFGSPLPKADFGLSPDGDAWTGTEWELHRAVQAAQAGTVREVMVFRDLSPLMIEANLPDGLARDFFEQSQRVRRFFDDCRDPASLAIVRRHRIKTASSPANTGGFTPAPTYVGSMKAGQRVMALLRKLYAGLKLQINEAKSAVGSVFGRKFLGYALWVAKGREVKCAVAHKAMDNFKARIRQLTRRSGGRSMEQVVQRLRPYLLGWKAYFGLAQTPKVWRELDEWLRHRLRAIQLKHWKRPTPMYRELQALGAGPTVAKRVAANSRRWWRNSDGLLKTVLTIAYFDRLGVPRLS